jgi:hypothetical protein
MEMPEIGAIQGCQRTSGMTGLCKQIHGKYCLSNINSSYFLSLFLYTLAKQKGKTGKMVKFLTTGNIKMVANIWLESFETFCKKPLSMPLNGNKFLLKKLFSVVFILCS